MVKILFFGDLVDSLGMAADEIELPTDNTDVERLVFHLSGRGRCGRKCCAATPN